MRGKQIDRVTEDKTIRKLTQDKIVKGFIGSEAV